MPGSLAHPQTAAEDSARHAPPQALPLTLHAYAVLVNHAFCTCDKSTIAPCISMGMGLVDEGVANKTACQIWHVTGQLWLHRCKQEQIC